MAFHRVLGNEVVPERPPRARIPPYADANCLHAQHASGAVHGQEGIDVRCAFVNTTVPRHGAAIWATRRWM